MLVLTRKKNETIVIADQISITVLRIKGGRICIGIDAPSNVPIRRRELPAIGNSPLRPEASTDLMPTTEETALQHLPGPVVSELP